MGRRVDLCEACKHLRYCEKEDGYHYKCNREGETAEYVHLDSYHELAVPANCPHDKIHEPDL
jgi:hypothetical protein